MLPWVVAGVTCVLVASYLAYRTRLAEALALDLKGARGEAQAEFSASGECRLRFEAPSGTIYRRTYAGGFGLQRPKSPVADVEIAYDPAKPERFQPAGISYVPAGVAGALFALGLYLVVSARKRLLGAYKKARAAARPDDGKRKGRTER